MSYAQKKKAIKQVDSFIILTSVFKLQEKKKNLPFQNYVAEHKTFRPIKILVFLQIS